MTPFGERECASLAQLFDPSGVAVVGASRIEGETGYVATGNAAAFDRPVYPVNPSGSGELFGSAFVSSVTEIDGAVGLALCCVSGPAMPDVLAECGAAGIGTAVICASGFAEAGTEPADVDAPADTGVSVGDQVTDTRSRNSKPTRSWRRPTE